MSPPRPPTEFVLDRVRDTPGLVALFLVGSGARGDVDPNSDWDFVAVIDDAAPWAKPFRDGGRETFPAPDGRQVEVMFATAGRLRRRMTEQAVAGIIATAEFLAEGRLAWSSGSPAVALQAEAQALHKSRPAPIQEHDLQWRCYEIWNQVKDLEDRLDDSVSAYYLAFLPFWNITTLFFRLRREWLPRPKAVFPCLGRLDPALYDLCGRFDRARTSRARLRILDAMMRHLSDSFDVRFGEFYTSPTVDPHE